MKFINQLTGEWKIPEKWQIDLEVGDYYVNERPICWAGEYLTICPTIYGKLENKDETPGYFWATAYSAWCPFGEYGLVTIVEPTKKITQEEFEQAIKELQQRVK